MMRRGMLYLERKGRCRMSPELQTEAWAEVVSKPGKPSSVERHDDPALSIKLGELSKKWQSREPNSEFSIMTSKGELVYMGRYEEGIVLRLSEDPHQIIILTTEMAERLGKKLVNKRDLKITKK